MGKSFSKTFSGGKRKQRDEDDVNAEAAKASNDQVILTSEELERKRLEREAKEKIEMLENKLKVSEEASKEKIEMLENKLNISEQESQDKIKKLENELNESHLLNTKTINEMNDIIEENNKSWNYAILVHHDDMNSLAHEASQYIECITKEYQSKIIKLKKRNDKIETQRNLLLAAYANNIIELSAAKVKIDRLEQVGAIEMKRKKNDIDIFEEAGDIGITELFEIEE